MYQPDSTEGFEMVNQASRVCGYCHKSHPWNWSGQKLRDGSKVYLDHSGHRWAGRRCPVCEKSRVASAVRHDSFDRDMIFQQLTERGFEITSKTHPVLVERAGQTLQVGIKRARMEGSAIMIESAADERDDIIALVFESVRLITPEQLQNMTVYNAGDLTMKNNVTSSGGLVGVVEHIVDPA
jgi:hypothetical protein